jgi:predicted permease
VLEGRGEKPGGNAARVVPLHDAFFGGATNGLTFLLGAVSFVLLIACANVANLLLAAGTARQKEMALRAATGARRGRLVQQLLTENLLLAFAGCGFGLALAFWGTRLFALMVPVGFPELLRHTPIDARVLAFALAISIASSLVFGLMPALRASRVDLNEVLKEGARGSSGGRRRGRSLLLVAEVALSMVLLVGAGLMMRAFLREQGTLPGFDTTRLMSADVLLGGTRYFDKSARDTNLVTGESERFYDRLLQGVRAIPGVTRAGVISRLPMDVWTHPFTIAGRPLPQPGSEPQADLNEVDAQALDTLGIRLLRGRMIAEQDTASSPWVAVVKQDVRRSAFPRSGSARAGDPRVDRSGRGRADRGAAAADDRRRRRRRDLSELLHGEAGRALHSVPAAPVGVRARGRVHPYPQGARRARRRRSAHARA